MVAEQTQCDTLVKDVFTPMPATVEEPPRLESKTGLHKHVVLRCLIYEEGPCLFVGECIDLDLIVKAKTPEATTKSLQAALIGYLKTAAEMGDESLLRRPSPLNRRIHYHWCCLKAALTHRRSNFRLFDWSPGECIAGAC
jgi:hypothetical protein